MSGFGPSTAERRTPPPPVGPPPRIVVRPGPGFPIIPSLIVVIGAWAVWVLLNLVTS